MKPPRATSAVLFCTFTASVLSMTAAEQLCSNFQLLLKMGIHQKYYRPMNLKCKHSCLKHIYNFHENHYAVIIGRDDQ